MRRIANVVLVATDQLRDLLLAARFDKVTLLTPGGGRAEPDASVFVALARRG